MNEQDSLFFNDANKQIIPTPFGETEFPILFYDTRSIGGSFIVNTSTLRQLLPHLSLKPLNIYPGSSLLTVFASQHRNTSIGAYNSLTLGFLIRYPPKFAMPGWAPLSQAIANNHTVYIFHRFLDQEKAIFVYKQILGESASAAKILFEDQGAFLKTRVTIQDKEILSLLSEKLPLDHQTPIELNTYSLNEEKLRHTLKRSVASLYGSKLFNSNIEIKFNNHPIGNKLKQLSQSFIPVSCYYTNNLIAKLYYPDKTWNINTRTLLNHPISKKKNIHK